MSIVMGLLNPSPTTTFSTLVNVNVEWAVGGQIDAGSFPSHLLKDPDFGVQKMEVSDFINGTICPLASDFDENAVNFLINTAQEVPLLDTNRAVWFNTPRNGYSRDLELKITYALNTTNGAYFIPTISAFEFEFIDNEGNVKATHTWIDGVKKYKGASQDPVQDRVSVRYIRDIDATVSLVKWTPKFYAWIDAFTPNTGRMQMAADDPKDTNRWDGSALTLTTGWSMPFKMDLTVISIEDSIAALRNAQMVREEFDNNGVIFSPRCATIAEAYQMLDKPVATGNLQNTFLNRGGIFDWLSSQYRGGFMTQGWSKDVTNSGQSLTNFGSADDESVNSAGIFNVVGGTNNSLAQLKPVIIGNFLLVTDGTPTVFVPPGFDVGRSADISWQDVFVLGTSVRARPRKYKIVSGYLDTGFSNIGDGNGSSMKRWGTRILRLLG